MAKIVVVATYPNLMHAEVARSKLAAAGIDAMITKDDAGGMIPSFQVFEWVRLLVREDDLPLARDVLADEPTYGSYDEEWPP